MSARRATWRVDGMHCPRCEAAIERALRELPGLRDVRADFARGSVTAIWDEDRVPLARIAERLQGEGYALRADGRLSRARRALQFAALLGALAALYALLAKTPAASWLSAFPVARAGMDLGALFIVGLMTSLHCVAMCGGINLAQSARAAQRGGGGARGNFLYNLGRVISYTAIGAIVGALGQVLSIGAGLKAAIQIAAAAFMLVMALNLLGGFSWLRRLTPTLPRGLRAKLIGGRAGTSSLGIGLANGLMPCGPLQSMQLYALSAGSWWMGALSMLCFSLGTVPLMLGFGLLGGKLNQKYASPMRVASAALVALMGASMLTSGLALSGVGITAAQPGADGAAALRGEVQVVRSELDYGSYPAITVRAGIPVEWTIVADAGKLNGCNDEIVIPALNMTVPLKAGETVIQFTPEKGGVIAYSCWMGMIRSSILVEDAPDDR